MRFQYGTGVDANGHGGNQVAKLVSGWANGTINNGLALKAQDEASTHGFRKFTSANDTVHHWVMHVHYDTAPNGPGFYSPTAGQVLGSSTVQLSALYSDPDPFEGGQSVFTVKNASGAVVATVTGSTVACPNRCATVGGNANAAYGASGGTVSLPDGSYTVTAQNKDNIIRWDNVAIVSAVSAPVAFSVSHQQNAPTSTLPAAGSAFGDDSSTTAVTFAATTSGAGLTSRAALFSMYASADCTGAVAATFTGSATSSTATPSSVTVGTEFAGLTPMIPNGTYSMKVVGRDADGLVGPASACVTDLSFVGVQPEPPLLDPAEDDDAPDPLDVETLPSTAQAPSGQVATGQVVDAGGVGLANATVALHFYDDPWDAAHLIIAEVGAGRLLHLPDAVHHRHGDCRRARRLRVVRRVRGQGWCACALRHGARVRERRLAGS